MPRFRSLPLLFICLLLVGLSGFSAYRIGQRLGIADLQATGLHRLDLYSASLEREISKYAFLPGTLGLERDVLALRRGAGFVRQAFLLVVTLLIGKLAWDMLRG